MNGDMEILVTTNQVNLRVQDKRILISLCQASSRDIKIGFSFLQRINTCGYDDECQSDTGLQGRIILASEYYHSTTFDNLERCYTFCAKDCGRYTKQMRDASLQKY